MKKLLLFALLVSTFFACKKAENEPIFENRDWFSELPDEVKPLIGHWTESNTSVENPSFRTFVRMDAEKGTDRESVIFHATGGLSFYPNFWKKDGPAPTIGCGFGDPKAQQIVFFGTWKMEKTADGSRILSQTLADPHSKKWEIVELNEDVLSFVEL